jgi:putative membrane protein
MRPFLLRWFVTTIAVLIAEAIVPGIEAGGMGNLLAASLLLGIVNAFIRPLVLILSLPLILLTLGFFILIVNALMLWMVGELIPGFGVDGFWSAFFGAILVSFVSWIFSSFFRGSDGKIYVITHHPEMKRARGRVIEG